ncbi:hypothetical protein GGR56DRAFT_619038 [Xylariaceae sp. FL0804]|nr:hypothetical protein GGR56DRAFT_619038 [Xylariaceae sp. FL0804]
MQAACKDSILRLFPDICPDYLAEVASRHAYQADTIISLILDQQEEGKHYPKSALGNPLKRKRAAEETVPDGDDGHSDDDADSDDNAALDGREPRFVRAMRSKIAEPGYQAFLSTESYDSMARTVLNQEFPRIPQLTIRNWLRSNGRSVFETYTAIDEARRNWDDAKPAWKAKKTSSQVSGLFTPDSMRNLDMTKYDAAQQGALTELSVARALRATKEAKEAAKRGEEVNYLQASRDGQVTECGICYEELPLNRMVQCDGAIIHWFCRACMKSQAETQIGMSKYELTCMSMDGCDAGFCVAQRRLFLDRRLSTALDRIEQEAVLREAGIENLETCPFCPFAAEYPPVEVDKEFRCEKPQCRQVSCRLCRKETHVPKTCAEAAAENDIDARRHEVEEAMSAALLRKCSKCQTPFLKSDGCNKITCTKCGITHCDVCRQPVTNGYAHFNDATRGGKNGQCALFDRTEERYQNEVRHAEEEARKRVAESNPQLDADQLQIKVSKEVEQDELRRKQSEVRYARAPQPRPPLRNAAGPGQPALQRPAPPLGNAAGLGQPALQRPAPPLGMFARLAGLQNLRNLRNLLGLF